MAPIGVARSGAPVVGFVIRGAGDVPLGQADIDSAVSGSAVRQLIGRQAGRAVVLARLSQPAPATPGVIDAVVDALFDAGSAEVIVGASIASRDRDRGHRSVSALAHLAGLAARTSRGRAYTVADLVSETSPAAVPPSSVLGEQQVSTVWASAQTRVVVARSVTDLVDAYAGCLATLLGAAPEIAGADPADVAVDLLRHLPPTLAVVDATTTSAGADGSRILDPVETGAVIVSADVLLADCTLAALLGEDRSASRLVERAIAELGSPVGRIEGDLTPWAGIRRPHPLARAAARAVAADQRVGRVLSAATGGPDEGAAPAGPVLASVRAIVTPAVQAATDPAGQVSLVGLLGAVTAATGAADAWAVNLDKGRVDRRVVPLGFDPANHDISEYRCLPAFFSQFDEMIDALPVPLEPDGMRWCLVDGATVFEVVRAIPADFDLFVERVDVAVGISLMADYLGGRRVAVGPAEDDSAETAQAERNLYLAQPNYLAAWGGAPIDVCKIELVERHPDQHRLTWRTIKSPNGSATHDDGTLTFARTGTGTVVTIRGRQLFSLPPSWAGIDLAALPEVREPLLEEAYRRFFTTTFDNLEACFEGREFRIGRPAPEPDEPLLTEALQLLLGAAGEWFRSRSSTAPQGASPDEVDVLGFRHVRGPR